MTRDAVKKLLVAAIGFAFVGSGGCVLFGLGDLTGGTPDAGVDDGATTDSAAGDEPPVDRTPFDAGEIDGAPITYASCNATHIVLPNAPTGFYLLTSPTGGAPYEAYCDMTNDNGGWMLVTPDMIANESLTAVTTLHSVDGNGGVTIVNYPNDNACSGTGGPASANVVTFKYDVPWSQIRAQYTFTGLVGCWSVFGSSKLDPSQNLLPFYGPVDSIYDQTKMGGVSPDGGESDDFDGTLFRCDQLNTNFWNHNVSTVRSAVVILRHGADAGAAGLATNGYCLAGQGSGTSGTTWWGYSSIYVR